MITVILYGHLAKKYGKLHKIAANSPAEVVRAFCSNFKDFKKDIIQDGQAYYKVLVGGENRSDQLDLNTNKTIKLVPVIAGKGGLGKIILGAALIYFSMGIGSGALGATFLDGSMTAVGFLGSAMSSIGWSMVLGGVSQLLFSPPKVSTGLGERPENKPSYAFGGAVNVTGQGNPVPICYGRLRVGSQVISTGLSVAQL